MCRDVAATAFLLDPQVGGGRLLSQLLRLICITFQLPTCLLYAQVSPGETGPLGASSARSEGPERRQPAEGGGHKPG